MSINALNKLRLRKVPVTLNYFNIIAKYNKLKLLLKNKTAIKLILLYKKIALHVSVEPEELSRYSDELLAARLGLHFLQGQEIFLYSTASRRASGPTQPPIQYLSNGYPQLFPRW
jgi:hypothetical protein